MLSAEKGRITATAKGTSSLLCIAGALLALTANVLLAAEANYTKQSSFQRI